MKLNKDLIGKYVTRIASCDYGNETKDFSYIGEKMKLLSIDEKHARLATEFYKTTLDNRWLDDNWKEYEEIIDIDNLDLKELKILQESLKALIRQDIEMNFMWLNKITKLGLKIDEQIRVLN